MYRINARSVGSLTVLSVVLLSVASCTLNTPATYLPPVPVPGTGTNPPRPPQVTPAPADRIFIENRKIRLGIDLKMGGSIVYLAEIGGKNVVNNFDYGRQVQTALYGGPVPYAYKGKNPPAAWPFLGWCPAQSGDFYRNTSRVITYQQDSTHIYVKTAPLFAVFFNEPADCTMEHWINLNGNSVHVRSRTTINRQDTTQYDSRPQEAPAVYLNAPYSRIQIYEGTQPFTNGSINELNIIDKDEVRYAPECWVAMLNPQGRGVGLFQPNQPRFNVGFFGKPGVGDENSNPTGYLSGKEQALLDHNSVYDYQFTLIMGTLTDIRQYVYSQSRPPSTPNFRFANDRQRWYYENTVDTGVPIRGELNVRFDGDFYAKLLSPEVFWRGSDVQKLYIQAAFKTPASTARLIWRRHGDPTILPSPDRYFDFPIVGDGQYRVYELDLNQVPGWRDYPIIQMGLSPTKPELGRTGQTVRIRSITSTQP
ncbi:MAG: hypothetical protein H7Z72_05305 [Bacteroidetes bacterium]|nr:hypothetical protein [Fibrella sp.]